jgi:hypothetical protein
MSKNKAYDLVIQFLVFITFLAVVSIPILTVLALLKITFFS